MKRRAGTRKAKRPRSARPQQAPKQQASTPWPMIESFLESEQGDISLGAIGGFNPFIGYTAVASDQHEMLVALVRRPGETLHQLLDRLERALGPALEERVFVDEINSPSPPPTNSRRR